MASGSSSMQAPTNQQLPPEGLGSRQADEPGLSGPRPGEVAATPVKVEPRPERRAFQSPLYRKAYLVQPTTNVQLEMLDDRQRVVQVNQLDLNTWARLLEKHNGNNVTCHREAPSGFRV